MEKNKVTPHPIVFVDAKNNLSSGLDLDRITSKKNAVFDALEQEKHSYAARFAEWIALEDYIVVSESDLNVFWSKQTESVSKTTSQLLSIFNEHEAKQDKIEKK